MRYLLDTNIISEIGKSHPNPHVGAWFKSIPSSDRYLSVITLGEIRRGIEKKRLVDSGHANRLEDWLAILLKEYERRILPFDLKSADAWGRILFTNPVHALDLQMAATAITHQCIMVTRNVRHFSGINLKIINPFEPQP